MPTGCHIPNILYCKTVIDKLAVESAEHRLATGQSNPMQQWFGLRCRPVDCLVECRTCNQEVAGSNLGRGYFAPRSTQPSIPPGSVYMYQLWLGRQRQVWLIPLADETQGVQVKLWYPLTMRAIPDHLGDVSCMGTIQIDITFTNTYQSMNFVHKFLSYPRYR